MPPVDSQGQSRSAEKGSGYRALDDAVYREDDPRRMDRPKLNVNFARGLSWAIALVSMIGATLWTDCPSRGAELRARTVGSLPGSADIEAASTTATATNLVGIDQTAAVDLLGPPTATENRAPADVWRYTSSRCELELVFYMEMRTGRMRSLHYAFKGEADTAAQRQACLAAIQENSHGGAGDRPESKVAVEFPSEKGALPVSEPSQPPRRTAHNRPAHARRYARWYDSHLVRNAEWGYTLALRYSNLSSRSRIDPTSYSASPTRGWGGGQFGPAPYSASGPQ